MASFAKVQILGNLGSDPETRYTPSGTMVVSFSMAVNPRQRQGQPEAPPTWYRISAWETMADRLDKLTQQGYLAKGRTLYVTGRLQPREFQGNDGQTRTSLDVTLVEFEFVGGDRREGEQGGQQGQGGNRGGNYGSAPDEGNSYGSGNARGQAFDDQAALNDPDDVPF